ncbi:MAG: hypothetical protein IKL97_03205, partial [Eggerthellaceae bacterium]|nr:hypothetical protein [Eggerthellaceae bacterium]
MDAFGYTTKQAKVVFKAWKQGKVEADKQVIDKIFKLADGKNHGVRIGTNMGIAVISAVDAIFRNDYRTAQKGIDRFAFCIEGYDWGMAINAEG